MRSPVPTRAFCGEIGVGKLTRSVACHADDSGDRIRAYVRVPARGPYSFRRRISESRSGVGASFRFRGICSTFNASVRVGRRIKGMPRPRQQQWSGRRGLDLAVRGLDQAVAVLDAEIGTLETQLKDKRDERRELQQTRTRLTKLGGNRSTAAAPRGTRGRRARTGASRSASAAGAAPAAAASSRRTRRRSAGRAPAADSEAAIIEAITGKPMTAVETAKAVGLSRPRARQLLKQLRDGGRVRVEAVSSGRGRPRRVYHAGSNGSSRGAGAGEGAAAASEASAAATSGSSTPRRSGGRRRTSTRKRSSGGGRTPVSG
jgi:hypothetical protein